MKNIYIAGPMTKAGPPDFNYPLFNSLEAWLVVHGIATETWAGRHVEHVSVLNPARNFDGATDRAYREYMRADLKMLAQADSIVLMPGWRESPGALLEVDIARKLELDFYEAAGPLRKFRSGRVSGWKVTKIDTPTHEPAPSASPWSDAPEHVRAELEAVFGPPQTPGEAYARYFNLPEPREPEPLADWERELLGIAKPIYPYSDSEWAAHEASHSDAMRQEIARDLAETGVAEYPKVGGIAPWHRDPSFPEPTGPARPKPEMPAGDDGRTTTFSSGATRDTSAGKLDFEGFYNPLVMERFARYMDKNRLQSNGSYRASDNWQAGFTRASYAKSLFRHFVDFWKRHRGYDARSDVEEALCAVIFNAQGYLLEVLLDRSLEDK